jgi:FlaA1/EpsC-like NDP-sugar epimerase
MDAPILSRKPSIRNRYLLVVDAALVVVTALLSFALRLEFGPAFEFYLPAFAWMAVTAVLIKLPVFYVLGLYRRMWVYASTNELKLIALSVTAASALVALAIIGLVSLDAIRPGFPRSVLLIDWLLSFFAVGGVRFLIRLMAENTTPSPNASQARRVLIIGAGDAGVMVAREMQKARQIGFSIIGFLDDDPLKQKQQISGIPVIGVLADLAEILDTKPVEEVLIAIPSAPGKIIRNVSDICRLKGVPFRTMPGMYELIGGKVNVSRLREVEISDLLRREPAKIQNELVSAALQGKRVLVTGAGGSIGREICRQIARWSPASLVMLGHGENSIFEALLELREDFPKTEFVPIIADVRAHNRIDVIFRKYQPEVVFHAAAHKHVPLMEHNVEEAITNNILGTRNVVRAAEEHNVERMVMISTDKAIRPVNVMGATKRIAEMIVLDAAHRTGRPFVIVRFGNVLGSRGSVVPLFKRQIARGGPVTVTHPDMRRYFMTIPEAVHLVLQAAAMGVGGEAFLLNMGQQVRILDLAEDLIRLSGLEPGRDIEIAFSGIRPGEKLSEDLWEADAHYTRTTHPDIFRFDREQDLQGEELNKVVENLYELARAGQPEKIMQQLDDAIPDATILDTPAPEDVTSVV